jgi:hypothetical protein
MAYSRQPQVVKANGGALKQTPVPSSQTPPGIVPVEIEALISTTTNLGVVQVGSGLSITPAGVLSATNSSSNFINVKLTPVSYTLTAADSYVGATSNNITITLPAGLLGRVYYVKNQANGNIRVQGTGGDTIDGSAFQTLGSNGGFMLVFDGTEWNIL